MSVTATAPSSSSAPKVWLITGCSSGIGRELALAALARGDFVIATARNASKLEDLVELGASGIALDVTASDETIEKIVADAVQIHGRIDILVNNAGYTLEGAIEECSEAEVYDQFNTNVFGMARMLRAVMPYLRAQKSGVVANVGSMVGWRATPAGGWYCATKFAIAGLSEALRFEVAHLGIDVTSVDLGSFRTSLLGGNMIVAKKHIAELDPATETTKQLLASRNGLQAGDPAKAAVLLVEALTKSGRCAGRTIPSRLVVGKDAVRVVGATLQKSQDELDAWTDLGSTTNFDEVAPPKKKQSTQMRTNGALDVVLRERDAVAALPAVVRAIRRFAETPLQTRLERALEDDDADLMERMLAQHREDVGLDLLEDSALDSQVEQYKSVTSATLQYVLQFGAQHGREEIVKWSNGFPGQPTRRAIRLAISNGHLSIVELLHGQSTPMDETDWMDTAASHGHLDILKWLYANRKDPGSACRRLATIDAARSGHVEVLKWLYANNRARWYPYALVVAVQNGHMRVAQWMFEQSIPADVVVAMRAALEIGSIDMLEWLHDHYLSERCPNLALGSEAYGRHAHAVRWLLRRYPDRYVRRGMEVAATCGDLDSVRRFFSMRRKPKRQIVKSAMCNAARRGHLHVLEWLFLNNARLRFPVRTLWNAVCGGYVDVAKWCFERLGDQRVRLDKVYEYAAKQHTIARGKLEVTAWLSSTQAEAKQQSV